MENYVEELILSFFNKEKPFPIDVLATHFEEIHLTKMALLIRYFGHPNMNYFTSLGHSREDYVKCHKEYQEVIDYLKIINAYASKFESSENVNIAELIQTKIQNDTASFTDNQRETLINLTSGITLNSLIEEELIKQGKVI